jgi:hypothetical protein
MLLKRGYLWPNERDDLNALRQAVDRRQRLPKIDHVDIEPGFDLAKLAGDGRIATGDVKVVPVGLYAKAALENVRRVENGHDGQCPGRSSLRRPSVQRFIQIDRALFQVMIENVLQFAVEAVWCSSARHFRLNGHCGCRQRSGRSTLSTGTSTRHSGHLTVSVTGSTPRVRAPAQSAPR